MPNYTKLFNSIITSTIWTEDDKTRIIWITLLAMSDQHGEVQASIPGLARIAGVTIEDCEASIKKLMSPDAYSRTPDFEGRRISPIDGGWELLNHGKYRLMASKEDEKANNAKRQRRHRERNASVTDSNANVTPSNDEVTQKRDIVDTDTKAEREREEGALAPQPPPDLHEIMPTGAAADMIALQKRIQSVKPAWKLALTYEEQQSMMRNGSCLASLDDADWKRITEYMNAKLPEGAGYWQPKSRGKFIESLPDVHAHACRWETANGNAPKRKGWT